MAQLVREQAARRGGALSQRLNVAAGPHRRRCVRLAGTLTRARLLLGALLLGALLRPRALARLVAPTSREVERHSRPRARASRFRSELHGSPVGAGASSLTP
ncbi:hypothetical protein WME90_42470 [Sorangium sp. So ce375]|uniref:hypothetical protein n=1 Tax=Sorangium sp. So ce375 TaxID=3133306 RepID=UPI003F5C2AD5